MADDNKQNDQQRIEKEKPPREWPEPKKKPIIPDESNEDSAS